MLKNNTLKIFIVLFLIGLMLSAIQPKEYFTWFLEVIPAIVGFVILVLTYKKFSFTNFTYFFILIHCIILFIGGHYTYAEVPLFEWIKVILVKNKTHGIKLNMRVKTVCFNYVSIASKFIRHSRKKVLQVFSNQDYKILQI